MSHPVHRVIGTIGGGSAAMTCNECSYGFIAEVLDDRIDLASRVWFDRGDRSVNHAYVRDGFEIAGPGFE